MTLVVNLYGGPGTGKSTTAAGVYSALKQAGVNAELVTEFAKDLTWEERHNVLANQPYILGKQYHRLQRLNGKVAVIITDGPLLNSIIYNNGTLTTLDSLVEELYDQFDNRDFFLKRSKPYNEAGRTQTEAEARALDEKIRFLLSDLETDYRVVETSVAIHQVTSAVLGELIVGPAAKDWNERNGRSS